MKFDDDGMTECPLCEGLCYWSRFMPYYEQGAYEGTGYVPTIESVVYHDAKEIAFEKKIEEIEFDFGYSAEKIDRISTEYSEKYWNRYTLEALNYSICPKCEGKGKVDWVTRIFKEE